MTWWWIAEVNGQRRGTMQKHPSLELAMRGMFGCVLDGYVYRSTRKRDAMQAMREPLNEQWQRVFRQPGFHRWVCKPWTPGMDDEYPSNKPWND